MALERRDLKICGTQAIERYTFELTKNAPTTHTDSYQAVMVHWAKFGLWLGCDPIFGDSVRMNGLSIFFKQSTFFLECTGLKALSSFH